MYLCQLVSYRYQADPLSFNIPLGTLFYVLTAPIAMRQGFPPLLAIYPAIVEALLRQHSRPQALALRAWIVLGAATGQRN